MAADSRSVMPGPAPPASSEVLVVGAVRNCAAHLRADVTRLRGALRPFRRIQWLLVESDSDDRTVATLRELSAADADFRFISLGRLLEILPRRSERIAFCRNVYLRELRTNPGYRAVDFVVVADFDGLNSLISETAVLSCWDRADWNVCAANQLGPYYDIWALRHPHWSPNNCSAHYEFLVRHGVGAERALAVAVHSRMLHIPKDGDWIAVDSAFGGLAVYRRRALENGEYCGVDSDGSDVCEHVALHRSIGTKIFINPRLINAAHTEQTEALRLRNKMARVLRRAVGGIVRIGRRTHEQRHTLRRSDAGSGSL